MIAVVRALKTLIIIGTRPEAIKLAPVVRALRHSGAQVVVCATGQHTDMLREALNAVDLVPDHEISLTRSTTGPEAVIAGLLQTLPPLIAETRPDWLIVQGDTASAFAGALAGYHAHLPVAHVEAGLRTGDLSRPWPEEAYRSMIARIAKLHFAPTEMARANLLAEGIAEAAILLTGNTVVDALHHALEKARQPALAARLEALLGAVPADRPLVLASAHRRESIGEGLRNIASALQAVASDDLSTIVFTGHPNPDVSAAFHGLATPSGSIRSLPPLDYLAFLHLLDRADIVVTDSGGIQEEASCLGKPVLVLRDSTERPEVLAAGNGLLVGTDPALISLRLRELIGDPAKRAAMGRVHNVFGDGQAAERIAQRLLQVWRFEGQSNEPAAVM